MITQIQGRKSEIIYGSVRLLLILILMLVVLTITAAELPTNKQTVAVVLSGGGAKGVAHIGVLRALEENSIPVDYIAGTSMGAIVGGLYAAGFSPDQIEELIFSKEFADASMGQIDKIHDYYFFHHDPAPTWITLKFNTEQVLGFQQIIRENIPTNLISPGPMDFMFMEKLGPASAVAQHNFDSLFIPFRCIASDIEKKQAVILRKGSLAEAVRASMTFPLYFKPITIDGRLLFDGGMYNNFPADVVLEDFQPDVLIGSVVASNPNPPCPDDIFSQLENMLMAPSDYELPEVPGIILYPKVPEISVTDFSRNKEVMQTGYQTTMEHMEQLLSIIQTRRQPQEVNDKRQKFHQKFPKDKIGRISLKSPHEDEGRFAKSFIGGDEKVIPLQTLKDNYFRLLSVNKFRHMYPRLIYDSEMEFYELELELTKNKPFSREIGGNLSSKSINQFFAKFAYEKLSNRPLTLYSNMSIGNNYNSAKLGIRLDFLQQIPFYLLAETTFSRWNYTTKSVFFFEEKKPSFINQREFLHDIRLVFPFKYKGKIELGTFSTHMKDKYYNNSAFSREDIADQSTLSPLGIYFSLEQNTHNHFQYPTQGSLFNITTSFMTADEVYTPGTTSFQQNKVRQSHQWWELMVRWENFFTQRNRIKLAFMTEMFLSGRPVLANYSATKIMAKQYSPFPLTKTRYLDGFRSNHYLAGGLKGIYKLSRNSQLQTEFHLFQSVREIIPDTNHGAAYKGNLTRPAFMHSTAIVYHTAMGPLSASISYFDMESDPWAFMINFGYILFNRKTF